MGLTTALYSSLSGLAASSQMLGIAGNNLANVSTVAFKDSRADFQTQMSENFSDGSAPTTNLGGTNPQQVGLGTRLAAITRNFTNGSIQPTGVPSDLALQGNGFFVVEAAGSQAYTRAGDFKLDANQNLAAPSGALVQGFGVDKNFKIVPGALTNLNIPLGNLTIAEATKNLRVDGNLDAGGTVAASRATITGAQLFSDAAHTVPATGATALTSLFNSSGNAMFPDGSVISLAGATKGTAAVPKTTFQVGAANTTGSSANGTTYQDLANFINNSAGIDTSIAGDPAGVQITGGQLVVTSNEGTINDLAISGTDLTVANGSTLTQPLTLTKAGTTSGESVRTTMVAYDSLGTPINVDVSLTLESRTSSGTTWRYFVQSPDSTGANPAIGNGTISFDTNGQLLPVSGNQFSIQRANTGAQPLQSITLQFSSSGGVGGLSSFSNTTSQIAGTTLDGSSIGTLQDYSVGKDGTITGVFSNTKTRVLGQLALADFANPAGLKDVGSNMFQSGAASGDAAIVTPGSGGSGTISGGALELSNVDLSTEFVNLISAQTGFSANSRVITASDRLIQELLQVIR